MIEFSLEDDVLRSTNVFLGSEVPPNLGMVTVLGLSKPVTEVTVNNYSQAFKFDTVHMVIWTHSKYVVIILLKMYFPFFQYLIIDKLDVKFESSIVITWKYS